MSRLIAHLVRVVTWPHWAEHRLRSTLTVVGVALGVATVIGIADVSESVLASFRHMVDSLAGDAELEITSAAGGVDEQLITRAAEAPGVRAAGGLVESFLPLAGRADETLYLIGVDFLGSPMWEKQFPRRAIDIPDELPFLAQMDSIVITRRFAARAHLAMGDRLELLTPGGPRVLHVRGMLGDEATPARLFDGAMAIMDLPAAQRLLGREGRVDRVAIQLVPGADREGVRAHLASALGPGVQVMAPEARGEQTEKLLFSLRSILASVSVGGIIVGAFVVYHTVAVSVQQRRRHFALLNAVGVGRRLLVRLCLIETLALTLPGMLIGLIGGRLLGALAAGVVGDTASEIWLRVDASQHAHSLGGTLVGLGVGLGTALLAAYIATRATFRAPTIEALRPMGLAGDESRAVVRPMLLAVLLVASAWLMALAPPGLSFIATVGLIVGAHSLAYAGGAVPAAALVSLVGRAARRLAHSLPSLPVRLAAENLPRNPGRSGATVATITATMSIAIVVAGVVQSFERAWVGWIEQHFAADLFVGSGTRVRLLSGMPISEAIVGDLAGVPGVASVEPFRVVPIRIGDRPAFLESISLRERLAHGGLPMVEGTLAAAAPSLAAGTGVLLSDNLAYRLGLHRGDQLEVPTPGGPRRFRVEGTFIDFLGSLDLGSVAVAHEQLGAIWGDRFASILRVWLAPGADPSVVRGAVLGRLGGGQGYYVLTARQFLEGVRAVVRQFFVATWALEVVAALVGIIGVVNAQLATVLDRAAEISVLRTIGLSVRDIARSVVAECAALGALGGIVGGALGVTVSAQTVLVVLRLVTGWRIRFEFPLGPLVVGIACATLISALAGYVPARAAARLEAGQRSVD